MRYKCILVLFLFVFSLTLLGCSDDKEYSISLADSNDISLLYEPLDDKYSEGTNIKLKINFMKSGSYDVYVNGSKIERVAQSLDYWTYSFTMPSKDCSIDIEINENEDVKYSFYDIFKIEPIELADIINASKSSQSEMTMPPIVYSYYENNSIDYKENIINYLNNVQYTVNQNQISYGDGYTSTKINLINNEIIFRFDSQDRLYYDNTYLNGSIPFPIADFELAYQTISNNIFKDYFSSFGNETELPNDYLKNIRFKPVHEEIEYLFLVIEDKDTFYMNGVKYEVVGDNNFEELIEGITDTTSTVNIYDEASNLLIKIKVSNNIVYSYEELIQFIGNINNNFNFELYLNDGLFADQIINEDINLKCIYKA